MSNLAQAPDDEPIYASVSESHFPAQYSNSYNLREKFSDEVDKSEGPRPLPPTPLQDDWR
jgi:hypothetical protein